jgi:hypothetical protein
MIKHETRTSTKTHELTALFTVRVNAEMIGGAFDHWDSQQQGFLK